MTRTNNTMTQSDNSINKITANTSNQGGGGGENTALWVSVCVCVDHCFSHTCGGCVISFLACPLKLDVKVIGAFEYSLTISVSVCVSVCV